jgi:hypothetical protein
MSLSADDAAEDGQGWLSEPWSSSSVQRKAAIARSSVSTNDASRRPSMEVHDDLGHHLLT